MKNRKNLTRTIVKRKKYAETKARRRRIIFPHFTSFEWEWKRIAYLLFATRNRNGDEMRKYILYGCSLVMFCLTLVSDIIRCRWREESGAIRSTVTNLLRSKRNEATIWRQQRHQFTSHIKITNYFSDSLLRRYLQWRRWLRGERYFICSGINSPPPLR